MLLHLYEYEGQHLISLRDFNPTLHAVIMSGKDLQSSPGVVLGHSTVRTVCNLRLAGDINNHLHVCVYIIIKTQAFSFRSINVRTHVSKWWLLFFVSKMIVVHSKLLTCHLNKNN